MKREDWLDLHATRLASIIYAKCVMNTSEGNWNVDLQYLQDYSCYDEIINDTELHELIEDKLGSYEGVLDLEREGTNYDVILGLAYFDYEDDEEDEDATEDEIVYLDYILGLCTYEDYLAVCEIEECQPKPRKRGDENEKS